jgi:hypothetical protein
VEERTEDKATAICSVVEMARKLGLSRARFYQLVNEGVFPPPARLGARRPCYTPDLQQRCLQIRRTGIGFDGRPVLFNKRRRSCNSSTGPGGLYDELVSVLRHAYIRVDRKAVKRAVAVLHPEGVEHMERGELLKSLIVHFRGDRPESV